MDIHKTVKKLRDEFTGGRRYFDSLDLELQNTKIVNELVKEVNGLKSAKSCRIYLVSSGKFAQFLNYSGLPIDIIVSGGWISNTDKRKLSKMDELDDKYHQINGKKFIFIDDSLYSGRTKNLIENQITRLGGEVIHTVVAYDGSNKKDKQVTGLYRYFDHFTN